MANKINNLIDIIIGILLCIPLFYSILYLLRLLIIQTKKKANLAAVVFKNLLFVFAFIVAIFLITVIVLRFMFPAIDIPYPWNVIGIVLFFLYYGAFFIAMVALGSLGHGGISPRNVVFDLYKLLVKGNKSNK